MYQCNRCGQYYDLSVEHFDFLAKECHKKKNKGVFRTIVLCPTCNDAHGVGGELEQSEDGGKSVINMFGFDLKNEDNDEFMMYAGIPKPFRFDKLHSGEGFPEANTMISTAKKQQANGVPDHKIFIDMLAFAIMQATRYHEKLVANIRKQTIDNIDELGRLDAWSDLDYIAEHAHGKRREI